MEGCEEEDGALKICGTPNASAPKSNEGTRANGVHRPRLNASTSRPASTRFQEPGEVGRRDANRVAHTHVSEMATSNEVVYRRDRHPEPRSDLAHGEEALGAIGEAEVGTSGLGYLRAKRNAILCVRL
jgi:hypothetical protein